MRHIIDEALHDLAVEAVKFAAKKFALWGIGKVREYLQPQPQKTEDAEETEIVFESEIAFNDEDDEEDEL